MLEDGINFFKTPDNLNSTFFVKSPFSYPNILSSAIRSEPKIIDVLIPEQFKNWFIVLSVYVILVLTPAITVPVAPKPMVESTVITDDPILIGLITLVFPVTLNVPHHYIQQKYLKYNNHL